VAFVGLKDPVQNGSLMQKIGEPGHVHGIEHVHLQEDFVSNAVPKEGDALD
jgi:hypothetical protein